jgi:2-(1,2-epoxy-1,2-dihydrophenyl)acetyl-CoA isomerase
VTEPAVVVDERDGVRWLTLNRPQRLNALSDEMLHALDRELSDLPSDLYAVVIRGAGRAFSSGHDLKHAAAVGPLSTVEARHLVGRMQRVAVAMRDCPVPIVTQVHGYAIGAGAEIALSGDVVLAEAGTVFRFPEAAVGRVVTNGFTNLLPKTVGPVRAKALLLLGEPLGAETAEQWGLVTSVCAAGELDYEVARVLGSLREKSAWAISAAKQLVNDGLQASFEASLQFEIGRSIEAELGADAEAGAASFAGNTATSQPTPSPGGNSHAR